MIELENIVGWMDQRVGTACRQLQVSVYIVGSYLDQPESCNDVDILVVVPEYYCKSITSKFRNLKSSFSKEFKLPLHYLITTDFEFDSSNPVIKNMLGGSHQKIF